MTRETWIQGLAAIDANGHSCSPTAPEAQKWCVSGWIHRHCQGDQAKMKLLFAKAKSIVGPGVSSWNDQPERTWPEVEALLRQLGL